MLRAHQWADPLLLLWERGLRTTLQTFPCGLKAIYPHFQLRKLRPQGTKEGAEECTLHISATFSLAREVLLGLALGSHRAGMGALLLWELGNKTD